MRIALVNLCRLSDFATNPTYADDINFLQENDISYTDYCSGRATISDQLDGFHQAISDPTIDLVFFVQGGSVLIKFLPLIDWDLVQKSNKKYAGLSDFTHFAFKSVSLGCECYYGIALRDVHKYWPTQNDQAPIIELLKNNSGHFNQALSMTDNSAQDLSNEKVIGGHIIISTFMLSQLQISLADTYLFLEYHNIPGESFYELEFWLDQLKYVIKNNQPKGFILGHSLLYEKDGTVIDYKDINIFLTEKLSELEKPIYQVDHFKNIIKLSI